MIYSQDQLRAAFIAGFDGRATHRGSEAAQAAALYVETVTPTRIDVLDPIAQLPAKGPGRNILLIRGGGEFGDNTSEIVVALHDWFVEQARARGVEGGYAYLHVPLIFIGSPDLSIEMLDEEQLAEHGWVRAERVFGGPA